MLALEIKDLVVRYGEVEAVKGITVSAEERELITFVGPSGCGKTTTLRAIAGLETPVSGRILLFGNPVFDAEKGINVPTEKREVSMVFQNYAIWPHMTVFENVAYGLRVKKFPKAEIREHVMRALSLVGLEEFANRDAPFLSGGQQQRVALARSIVFNPKVLLFDEPLSNLDAKLRAQMRIELKEVTSRVGVTSVYVTHDQEEALTLSDKIVLMDDGLIRQQCDPLTAYYHPANSYVAEFIGGSNIIRVIDAKESHGGVTMVRAENGKILISTDRLPPHGLSEIAFKSAHLNLMIQPPSNAENLWKVKIRRRIFVGDFVEYFLDWDGIELRARELSKTLFEEGQTVYCSVSREHVVLLSL